ncbi:MAG: sigma-70 family RNA polymerase sigma factor [Spirosomataceae bacterium]
MNNHDASVRFLEMLEAHKGILYKVARSYCRDSEDRKDLLQEMTVQLWRSFETYNGLTQYSTWIYRIVLNVAISFYRKESRRKQVSGVFSEGILELADGDTTEEMNENLRLLQQFISELKELDKALLLLYLEEKSHKEIAEIIGISETNAATKIGRIKTQLKHKFTNQKK